jgi:hypothetical protein
MSDVGGLYVKMRPVCKQYACVFIRSLSNSNSEGSGLITQKKIIIESEECRLLGCDAM